MCSSAVLIAWAALVAPALAQGKVFLRVEQATKLAFPGAKVEKRTVYLTKAQRQKVDQLAARHGGPGGEKTRRGIVFPYVATKAGKLVGTAYVDVRRVRTKSQAIMVVVTPSGKVGRVELLAFAEPATYIPPKPWYRHLEGKVLDEKLKVKGSIKGVSGATLTAKATAAAMRRTLALHSVLNPKVAKAPAKKKRPKEKPVQRTSSDAMPPKRGK